ncbi:MAG: DUF4184 family protein [Pedobacter sp.]|nr:MAG: DUF4184 family protein [Pedobacter sp.]
MPLTFAHPALILPFTSISARFVSVTGLIVGSMVPDFEYFIRLKIESNVSHALTGLLWFDMPVGVLVCLGFHVFARRSLLRNLPAIIQQRVPQANEQWLKYFAKHWPIVLLSLMIGASSHLVWDAFTHRHGFGVIAFPILADSSNIFGQTIPVFKLLQHSSTVIGAICIFIFVVRAPKVSPVDKGYPSLRYWLSVAAFVVILLAIKLVSSGRTSIGDLIATATAGLCLGLLLVPIGQQIFSHETLTETI